MQINIFCKHFSLGESLKSYVNEKLKSQVIKYFDHTISCDVNFEKITHSFLTHIIAHTGVKTTIISDASASDVNVSFDLCLSKLVKRLNKYKSKLKDYHHKMKMSERIESRKYIIQVDQDNLDIAEDRLENHDGKLYPIIIAEKPVEILSLTIKDALMKMDLENLPALIFTNVDSNRLNVVYYRKDGNISWIDSK